MGDLNDSYVRKKLIENQLKVNNALRGEPALEASKNRFFRGFFWEGKKYPIETKLSGFIVIYFNSLLKFFQKDTCHIMPGTSVSPRRLECTFVVRRERCRSQFPSETKNPEIYSFFNSIVSS